ncbi:hypothetical protein N7530_001603 [Penicillium desertorum]|uniref:Uncharacterized protein n=1 Tax=Penicillium desertorum TaxID=1303715 RepID=A0A9X0BWG7_9EURO|nr:hypothetical protein N7530_001603 [Penicillium desertorum]
MTQPWRALVVDEPRVLQKQTVKHVRVVVLLANLGEFDCNRIDNLLGGGRIGQAILAWAARHGKV